LNAFIAARLDSFPDEDDAFGIISAAFPLDDERVYCADMVPRLPDVGEVDSLANKPRGNMSESLDDAAAAGDDDDVTF
jgi:hypothetical protein